MKNSIIIIPLIVVFLSFSAFGQKTQGNATMEKPATENKQETAPQGKQQGKAQNEALPNISDDKHTAPKVNPQGKQQGKATVTEEEKKGKQQGNSTVDKKDTPNGKQQGKAEVKPQQGKQQGNAEIHPEKGKNPAVSGSKAPEMKENKAEKEHGNGKAEENQEGNDNNGHAYGKDKDEETGREFGQNRAEEARAKPKNRAEKIDRADGDLKKAGEDITKAKDKFSVAEEKLRQRKDAGEISEEEFVKRADRLNVLKVNLESIEKRQKESESKLSDVK